LPRANSFSLAPLSLCNRQSNGENLLSTLVGSEDYAVIVRKNNVLPGDRETSESSRDERLRLTGVKPLRSRGTCSLTEDGKADSQEFWCVGVAAPDYQTP